MRKSRGRTSLRVVGAGNSGGSVSGPKTIGPGRFRRRAGAGRVIGPSRCMASMANPGHHVLEAAVERAGVGDGAGGRLGRPCHGRGADAHAVVPIRLLNRIERSGPGHAEMTPCGRRGRVAERRIGHDGLQMQLTGDASGEPPRVVGDCFVWIESPLLGVENPDAAPSAARGSMAYAEGRLTVVGIAELSATDTLYVARV